jgi:hypothetical protein
MNAPKEKVLKKFLAAHRKRSQLMTSQFLSSLVGVPAASGGVGGEKKEKKETKEDNNTVGVSVEHHLTSAAARQYHQNMLVGLIEACKGITELFHENSSSVSSPPPSSATSAGSSAATAASLSSLLSTAEIDFTSTMKETIEEYTKSISKGFSTFFSLYHNVFQSIPLDLSSLNDHDMNYLDEIFHFNLKVSSQSASSSSSAAVALAGGSDSDDEASSDGGAGASHDGETTAAAAAASSSSSSSEKFILQDERGSWLLLARQAILDVKYLDSTFTETVQKLSSLSSASASSSHRKTNETAASSSAASSFSISFAKSLLSQIQNHITFMRKYTISCFVNDLLHWFPKVITILEYGSSFSSSSSSAASSAGSSGSVLSASDGSNRDRDRDRDRDDSSSSAPHTSSSSTASMLFSPVGPSSSAASLTSSLLAKKTQGIAILFKLLSTHAFETFSDCARFVKPLIDIYEVANLDPVLLCKNLIVEFSSYFTAEIEKRVGITRNMNVTTAAGKKKQHHTSYHSSSGRENQYHGQQYGQHGQHQHQQQEENEEEIDIEEIPEMEFNKKIGKNASFAVFRVFFLFSVFLSLCFSFLHASTTVTLDPLLCDSAFVVFSFLTISFIVCCS